MAKKLKEFTLFNDNYDKIHINPSSVASVIERENRRAYGGYQQTALIRLLDGTEYEVLDGARKVVFELT